MYKFYLGCILLIHINDSETGKPEADSLKNKGLELQGLAIKARSRKWVGVIGFESYVARLYYLSLQSQNFFV